MSWKNEEDDDDGPVNSAVLGVVVVVVVAIAVVVVVAALFPKGDKPWFTTSWSREAKFSPNSPAVVVVVFEFVSDT